MLCRWLAVLVLAGFLLVIEAIAVSQGTFTRDQRVLSGSLQGSRNVSGVPAFETNVPRNVTTAVGQTAFLHCRVHQLGDKEESNRTPDITRLLITLNQLRKFAHFLATIESSPHLERRKDREELDQEKGADIVPAEVVPDGAEVARTDRSNRNKLHVKTAGHFL